MKHFTHRIRVFSFLVTIPLLAVIYLLLSSQPVSALNLKVAPLLFEEKLSEGEKKKGFVDISNPNDQAITITTDVQAFRQINTDGDLEIYPEEAYKQGVKFDFNEFKLESREALRLYFLLDANQLPKGGVYATMLFTTTSGGGNPDNTSIQPATRVGTHLLIENGGGGEKNAFIKELKTPLFQFGDSLKASVLVSNAKDKKALAFFPEVSVSSAPLGESARLKSPLIMPGNSRQVKFELPANHFGLVRLKAETQGKDSYAWTFAATGHGRWLGPLLIVGFAVLIYFAVKHKKLLAEIKSFKQRNRRT